MPDRTESRLRPLMRACPVAVVLPAGLPAETGRQDYQALIYEYRRGDTEAVVTKLAAMGPDEIERLRPASAVAESPWDWAASILLRTEAKHRYFYANADWSLAPDEETNRFWSRVRHRIEAPSLRDVRAIRGHAIRTGDDRLQAYCREWYLSALYGSTREFLDESRDLLRGDPAVLLARGRYLEFWMGADPRYVRRDSRGAAVDLGRYVEFFIARPDWAEPNTLGWAACIRGGAWSPRGGSLTMSRAD